MRASRRRGIREPQTLHAGTSTALARPRSRRRRHLERGGCGPECIRHPSSPVGWGSPASTSARKASASSGALVPAPAPVRLQNELRAEMAEPIAKAEALWHRSPGLRLHLEAALQLARLLESAARFVLGSDDFDRADRSALRSRSSASILPELCQTPFVSEDELRRSSRRDPRPARALLARTLPAWVDDPKPHA